MQATGHLRGNNSVRVLLVDDERALGLTLARAMGDDYDMICETSTRDALRRLENDRDFDAIICDVNMPDGSGVALYEKLARHWPGLEQRVIFITGGINDDCTSRYLARLPNSCLEKPFDIAVLENLLPAPQASS